MRAVVQVGQGEDTTPWLGQRSQFVGQQQALAGLRDGRLGLVGDGGERAAPTVALGDGVCDPVACDPDQPARQRLRRGSERVAPRPGGEEDLLRDVLCVGCTLQRPDGNGVDQSRPAAVGLRECVGGAGMEVFSEHASRLGFLVGLHDRRLAGVPPGDDPPGATAGQ